MSVAENKAVFLSYASQDAAAVARIAEALRAAGVEVWFDQNELVGGDAWDKKIRQQIRECAIFVPVISANTQARAEGYFRLEWLLAVERSRLMSDDHPFLFPVVIDDTTDAGARVPDRFRDVQWTRLNVKDTPESLAARVAKVLGQNAAGVADPGPASTRPATTRAHSEKRFGDPWMRRVGVIFALLLGLIYATRPLWKSAAPRETAPPAAARSAQSTAPQTEAQQLVEKARKIFDEGDELNRENYFLAEDLVARAGKIDPAEPLAWALHARISYYMLWHSIDTSEARREAMRSQAERAHALAPELSDVAIVWADVRGYQREDLPSVERDLLALAAREPKNWLVQRSLGGVYRNLGRPDDAIAAYRREVALAEGAAKAEADLVNVLFRTHHLDEAEATVAQALAKHATGRLRAADVWARTQWRGDLAGAEAALATWPDWLLREDRGAILAWRTVFWSKRPDKALVIAQRMQRDYLRDSFFVGPRAVLTARAHEMAGHVNAAREDWRTVVQTADRVLASAPTDSSAVYWKAWALARLGDISQAQMLAMQMQQRNQLSFRAATSNPSAAMYYFQCPSAAPLWAAVGRPDLALAELRGPAALNDDPPITRAMLELDPAFDPLRTEAGFKEVLAAAPAPKAKEPDVSAPAKSDDKSVAVLAFADQSPAHDSEYFSDGISEELIKTLGKVPGLKVPAPASSFYFKGKNRPMAEIAQQLGVAYVIEGSVARIGDQVKIRASLTKVADGFQVWTDSFTRDAKNVFAVEEEIADVIAKNLSLKLGASPAAATASVNPQALEFYLQAHQLMRLRDTIFVNTESVEELLNRALALEPNFARAQALLATVWVGRGGMQNSTINQFGHRHSPERARVEAKAQQALALDPTALDAHLALALGRWIWWDRAGAEDELRAALSLSPSDARAHRALGYTNMDDGRMDDAMAEMKLAVQLDPLSQDVIESCARVLHVAGRYTEAIAMYDRALALGDSVVAREHKAYALAQLGQKEAAVTLARTLAIERDRFRPFAAAGARAEAEATFPATEPQNRAYYLFVLGRTEEALAALDPDEVQSTYLHDVLYEPWFDPVRADPRFKRILATLGVTEAHTRAQIWRKAHPAESGGPKAEDGERKK